MTRSVVRTALLLAPALILGAVAFWVFAVPESDALLSAATPLEEQGPVFPAEGPAVIQPVLVLIDRTEANPFARYVCEILRAEGLFAFDVADLSTPGSPVNLTGRRLVIGASQSARLERLAGEFRRHVMEGGALLLHHPATVFDDLLGIRSDGPPGADGYLVFPPAAEEVQVFGPWRRLRPAGADVLAVLRERRGAERQWTAAGMRRSGAGTAAFLAFDPGTSVVYSRQGRPPGVLNDRDGDGAFRTADLFTGVYDAQSPFVPHADELQRFILELVYDLLGADAPPRVWYFPGGADAVALITGDAHDTSRETVVRMADTVAASGGRFSLIEYPRALDSSFVSILRLGGHDAAPHPHYPRTEDPWARWRLKLARWFSPMSFFQPRLTEITGSIEHAASEFRRRTGSAPLYTRMHFLCWWGWSETAHALADRGFRMDLTCTGSDPTLAFLIPAAGNARSPAGFGYATGSGRPMRYVTPQGDLLPIFGQLTQVEDDVIGGGFSLRNGSDSAIVAAAREACRRLIDESVSRYHTVLTFNFHPEHAAIRWPPNLPLTMPWIAPTLAHLQARGVPMPDVPSWVRFTEGRQGLRMHWTPAVHPDGPQRLSVLSDRPLQGVTILFPQIPGQTSTPHAARIGSGADAPAAPVTVVRRFGRDWYQVILDFPAGVRTDILL